MILSGFTTCKIKYFFVNKKLFEVKVKIGNDLFPGGIGSDKKTAEQQAAQLAIDSIDS